MKLLDKHTLNKEKSVEKKKEVEEAVKLATKIDDLRRLKTQEEANLVKFRDESLSRIKDQISKQWEIKDTLLEENRSLEAQSRELRKPLDEQWDLLKKSQADLNLRDEMLKQRISQFLTDEHEQSKRREEIELEEERVVDLKNSAETYLSGAVRTNSRAIQTLENAEKKATETLAQANQRTREVVERETECAAKERDLENKDKTLKRKETILINKERALNDKYATLLRTQKRLNDKRK